MKLQVGDLVRVRRDLVIGKKYGQHTFVPPMHEHIGIVGEVLVVGGYGSAQIEGMGSYWFTPEMVELVIRPKPKQYRELHKYIDVIKDELDKVNHIESITIQETKYEYNLFITTDKNTIDINIVNLGGK